AEGAPIEIMNSDCVLELLLGRISPVRLLEIYDLVSYGYPLGLATRVGVISANAAFSPRPKDQETFHRDAYHGEVIWGWQQVALIVGAKSQEAMLRDTPEVRRMGRYRRAYRDAAARGEPEAEDDEENSAWQELSLALKSTDPSVSKNGRLMLKN